MHKRPSIRIECFNPDTFSERSAFVGDEPSK